ncbi:hypothetical protein OUZ56_007649 [Daphnia magna]|uniref:Uncharacterized protein n=1 Tax=Daphnia magna TaxID=35525 RepID=A0ABR0AAR2_9CRUS|nr:hypothetical protein OUZ56_007649 [Daphnia magna]
MGGNGWHEMIFEHHVRVNHELARWTRLGGFCCSTTCSVLRLLLLWPWLRVTENENFNGETDRRRKLLIIKS